MITVRIEGEVPVAVARRAVALLSEGKNSISAEVGDCICSRSFTPDPGSIVQAAVVIAGVLQGIVAGIQLYAMASERQKWSRGRLMTLVEDELTRQGVVAFQLEQINGFENLTSRATDPCSVDILDQRTHKRLQFLIFCDGDRIVLRA